MKRFFLLFCTACVGTGLLWAANYAFLGDSNTWNGGTDCSNPDSWTYWVCEQMEPTGRWNFARSGATWTHTTQTERNTQDSTAKLGSQNVIYNQVARLIDAVKAGAQPKPDVIFVMAGTNDAWFDKARPQAFSKSADKAFEDADLTIRFNSVSSILSIAEAVRFNCEWLKASFPKAQIILLTPPQTTATTLEKIQGVGNLLEACGQKMNIPVIRLDNAKYIDRSVEMKGHKKTKDGTHTNPQGAQVIGNAVVRYLNDNGIR